MKATPEDVAKTGRADRMNGEVRGPASMKATPEDVAKEDTDRVGRHDQSRLNEGHARRRGEAASCPQGRDRAGASMKATPEDVAKADTSPATVRFDSAEPQ